MSLNSPSPHRRSSPARTASRERGLPARSPMTARTRSSGSGCEEWISTAVTAGGAAVVGAARASDRAAMATVIHARRPVTGCRSPKAEAEHDVGTITALAVVLPGQEQRGPDLILDPHRFLAPGRRGVPRGDRSLLTGEAVELARALGR